MTNNILVIQQTNVHISINPENNFPPMSDLVPIILGVTDPLQIILMVRDHRTVVRDHLQTTAIVRGHLLNFLATKGRLLSFLVVKDLRIFHGVRGHLVVTDHLPIILAVKDHLLIFLVAIDHPPIFLVATDRLVTSLVVKDHLPIFLVATDHLAATSLAPKDHLLRISLTANLPRNSLTTTGRPPNSKATDHLHQTIQEAALDQTFEATILDRISPVVRDHPAWTIAPEANAPGSSPAFEEGAARRT